MKNIVAIIQARMGSKRLPNKMMLFFQGHPVIEWVRFRVNQASLLDQVVFALPEITHCTRSSVITSASSLIMASRT